MDKIKTESIDGRLMKIGMAVVDILAKEPYESKIIHIVSLWDGKGNITLRVENETEFITNWKLSELVALGEVKKFRRNTKRPFSERFTAMWRDRND
jgi:predicted dinucleotide-utilizing enzyme